MEEKRKPNKKQTVEKRGSMSVSVAIFHFILHKSYC